MGCPEVPALIISCSLSCCHPNPTSVCVALSVHKEESGRTGQLLSSIRSLVHSLFIQQIIIATCCMSEPALKAEDTKQKDYLSCWGSKSSKVDSFS